MDMKVMDRGLAYGEACFETFRVIKNEVFGWPSHLHRLATGLAEFGLVLDSTQMLLIENHCLTHAATIADDVLMRLTVTGGKTSWGLSQHAAKPVCYVQTMPVQSGANQAKSMHLQGWPFPLKEKKAKFVADYAETLRALSAESNTDVLFSHQGYLLGAATANVLLYHEGQWRTPSGSGVLAGIVREFLMEAGLVHGTTCPVAWLENCEAMLLSNCGVFLQPVAELTSGSKQPWSFDPCHPAIRQLAIALAGQPGVPAKVLL